MSINTYSATEPLWRSGLMRGETIAFIRHGHAAPCGSLLLPVRQIERVTNTDGSTVYVENEDFVVGADRRQITLTPRSQIPFRPAADLTPAPRTANSIGACRHSDRHLLFSEQTLFPRFQTRFDYTHTGWDGPVPSAETGGLPRLSRRLRSGSRVHVSFFGDSITWGSNATAVVGIAPHTPPYPAQVATALGNRHAVDIVLSNEAVGGQASPWGVESIDRVCAHNPHLVVLAWGMNDASQQRSADAFAANIGAMMHALRDESPDTEFVLVAPMSGNPAWTGSEPLLYPAYRDALRALRGEGAVLADVTTPWEFLLTRKRFIDITGNGVNHPNDFGHALYAQLVTDAIERGIRDGDG